jgi:hypothetical protein
MVENVLRGIHSVPLSEKPSNLNRKEQNLNARGWNKIAIISKVEILRWLYIINFHIEMEKAAKHD